jgi:hypothetical protein
MVTISQGQRIGALVDGLLVSIPKSNSHMNHGHSIPGMLGKVPMGRVNSLLMTSISFPSSTRSSAFAVWGILNQGKLI